MLRTEKIAGNILLLIPLCICGNFWNLCKPYLKLLQTSKILTKLRKIELQLQNKLHAEIKKSFLVINQHFVAGVLPFCRPCGQAHVSL